MGLGVEQALFRRVAQDWGRFDRRQLWHSEKELFLQRRGCQEFRRPEVSAEAGECMAGQSWAPILRRLE